MRHIDDGTLHAQLDGALDALEQAGALPDCATAADVRVHLESCSDCSARLRDAMAVRERAGLVLRDVGGERVDAPPFDTVHETRSSNATQLARRSAWLPLTWAATVLLAIGAGWWGSALYRTEPLRTADVATESTTSARVQADVQQIDAQSAAAPRAGETDAAEPTSPEPVASGNDAAASAGVTAAASAPPTSSPAEQRAGMRAEVRERAFGSATQNAPSIGTGIETFRAQVAIAQTAGAVWTVIDPAAADTLTAAYVIDDVANATFAVGVPLLGMSPLVRVQQRLPTGDSVEMLMSRPVGVTLKEFSGTPATALGLSGQSADASARKAAPTAEVMRWQLGIDVVSSEQLGDGTSEVIVRVAGTGAFISIRGQGTPAELAQLARRLIRPPGG